MNRNKKTINMSIALISLIVTQLLIRAVGIENISAQIYDTILIAACVGTILLTFKHKEKGLGVIYNITLAILMVIMCVSICIVVTMIKCFPVQAEEHSMLLLFIGLGSFISFTIFLIATRIIYDIKSK